MSDWIEEKYNDGFSMKYRVLKTLYSEKSPYQHVSVVETANYGRMLLNDGLVMVTERDEFIYHEMIAHVPLFTHPNPKAVLVVGGGDGGTVREVLKHPSIENVTLVEIDEKVIQACKEFIPQTAAALSDPRVTVCVEDAVDYVKRESAKTESGIFDVILVDSSDPIGPATPLFDSLFYEGLRKLLRKNGIVVSQAESVFYEGETQKSLLGIIRKLFSKTTVYNYSNMTYPGSLWSFSFASNELSPIENFDPRRVSAAGLDLQYYNIEIHKAAFSLPEFMWKNLKSVLKPS